MNKIIFLPREGSADVKGRNLVNKAIFLPLCGSAKIRNGNWEEIYYILGANAETKSPSFVGRSIFP